MEECHTGVGSLQKVEETTVTIRIHNNAASLHLDSAIRPFSKFVDSLRIRMGIYFVVDFIRKSILQSC